MSKVLKTLKKNEDIEWRYVRGKRTPFRNGKELKIGTRPKELIKAVGGDLSNAFRDVLKIGRVGKNPQFDPETGRPLNMLEAQRLNKLNDAKLENYDDSKEVAEFGEYQRKADIWNKAEGRRNRPNLVQTPSPTWGVVPPDAKSDAKPNLAQTPSPTWGIDQERAEWLHKTRNSPAARAGMSDEMRWQARQNHLEFQRKRKNKKKLSIKD